MRQSLGIIEVYSQGDSLSDYSSGPVLNSWSVRLNSSGLQSGDIDSGVGTTMRIPVQSSGNLCILAISCAGMTVKRNIDPTFAWEGGVPDAPIELNNYDEPPASSDSAASIKVSSLWVLTDRLSGGHMIVSSPTSGRWSYTEGEAEDAYRVWDPVV